MLKRLFSMTHRVVRAVALALVLSVGMTGLASDGRYPVYLPASGTLPIPITTSGSHYLTEDISVNTTSNVIDITASDVTLDLAGHTIENAQTSGYLIRAQDRAHIRIVNGQLVGGNRGVSFISSVDGAGVILEDLRLQGQSGAGIRLEGTTGFIHPIVRRCTASGTVNGVEVIKGYPVVIEDSSVTGSDYGIRVINSVAARIEGNVVRDAWSWAGIGFVDTNDAIVVRNVLTSNAGGVDDDPGGSRKIVSENLVTGNTGYGIRLGVGSSYNAIRGNTLSENGLWGIIVAGYPNVVEGNTIATNQIGIVVYGDWNVLWHNDIANSTHSTSGWGIHLDVDVDESLVAWNSITESNTCHIRLDSDANYNTVTNNRLPRPSGGCGLSSSGSGNTYVDNLP